MKKKVAEAKNWSSVYNMQFHKAVENKMFPHFLATAQWALLVTILAFKLNFSVVVTGAVANGGLKVIMLFHLWMLFFPVVLCLMLYRVRKEGIAESCIIVLSMIAFSSSILNVSLHFVNDFVLLMKAAEVVAWVLFNSVFSVSLYKISIVFLLPVLGRLVKVEKEKLRTNKLGA